MKEVYPSQELAANERFMRKTLAERFQDERPRQFAFGGHLYVLGK